MNQNLRQVGFGKTELTIFANHYNYRVAHGKLTIVELVTLC